MFPLKTERSGCSSFPVGSLSLYKECVKHIVPGEGSLKRLKKSISAEIGKQKMFTYKKCSPLVCVGGTARAVLRIAKKLYALPPECHTVSRKQLDQLCSQLYQADRRSNRSYFKAGAESYSHDHSRDYDSASISSVCLLPMKL